jgi:hypothetical protein
MSTSTPIGTFSATTDGAQADAKASGFGQMAADKVDQSRRAAAAGLGSAANALHDKADSLPGARKVAGAAHKVADALGSTAEYVRTNDLKSMMGDLQKLVKDNPGTALLTAAVLGFLIARTFSRN